MWGRVLVVFLVCIVSYVAARLANKITPVRPYLTFPGFLLILWPLAAFTVFDVRISAVWVLVVSAGVVIVTADMISHRRNRNVK